MPKTTLTQDDINSIINIYQNQKIGTHALGEQFKVGHKKITQILKDNNITIRAKGGQITIGNSSGIEQMRSNRYESNDSDKKLIAVCKKTGITYEDINNLSGSLTRHILDTYGSIPIPTNTYQRKKYELTHGKKWFEEYFDIRGVIKISERKCKYCNWSTTDIDNKTGCYEIHLKQSHDKSIAEYLTEFPEDKPIHKNFIKNEEINKKHNHIVCKICIRS